MTNVSATSSEKQDGFGETRIIEPMDSKEYAPSSNEARENQDDDGDAEKKKVSRFKLFYARHRRWFQ